MTVQDLITQSLNEIGVSSAVQGPNAQDLALGLVRANLVLDGWNSQSDLLPYSPEVGFVSVAGKTNYEFSTDLNLAPAAKIDRLIISLGGPRKDLEARSFFGGGGLLSIATGTPTAYAHLRQYPNTNLFQLQPTPDAIYPFVISYWRLFQPFASLNDTVSLPSGYSKALMLQVGLELAPAFEVDPARLAVTSENWKNIMTSLKGLQPDGPRNASEKAA